MQLETNPSQNQAELENKRKKLAELENKQKKLDQQLPLTTQITNLQAEINQLTNKPTRNQVQEALLESKKKQLAKLLKKQSNTTNSAKLSNKTALAVGCGIFGVILIGLALILVRKNKNKKY